MNQIYLISICCLFFFACSTQQVLNQQVEETEASGYDAVLAQK